MQIHGQMMLWLSVMMFIMNLQSIRPQMAKFVLQEKMDYPHGLKYLHHHMKNLFNRQNKKGNYCLIRPTNT